MFSQTLEILKTIVIWATFPLWFPVLAIFLVTEIGFLPAEWRLWREMKRASRTAALDVIAAGGTVIHDRPTFSWGISRLWWTPDDVLARAPVQPVTPEQYAAMLGREKDKWHAFDRWVTERYLDPSTGCAVLIAVWHPNRMLRRIRNRFPSCPVVGCFSGGQGLEQMFNELDAIESESGNVSSPNGTKKPTMGPREDS